jgi:hypothetical protein
MIIFKASLLFSRETSVHPKCILNICVNMEWWITKTSKQNLAHLLDWTFALRKPFFSYNYVLFKFWEAFNVIERPLRWLRVDGNQLFRLRSFTLRPSSDLWLVKKCIVSGWQSNVLIEEPYSETFLWFAACLKCFLSSSGAGWGIFVNSLLSDVKCTL